MFVTIIKRNIIGSKEDIVGWIIVITPFSVRPSCNINVSRKSIY